MENLTKDTSMCKDVYVDGSYRDGIISGAIIFVDVDEKLNKEFYFSIKNEELSKHRNVSGELLAAMYAVYHAARNSISCIIIHHDYEGIAKWASGEWKTNTHITKLYQRFLLENQVVNCKFVKVDAHSGDKYNDRADKLARFALENGKSNIDIGEFLNYLSAL